MAHQLTIRKNGRAEMAYVGELPWHKLGQQVTHGATIETWKKEAGLDWEARIAVPIYYDDNGQPMQYDDFRAVYRSDTSAPVGMVSSKYKLVQPAEVLEFFRDLTESGGWHIHTAGSMRGGSTIWAMASADIEGNVGKNDKIKGNLLLATSLDGKMKTTAKLTSIRVVCANTLAIALHNTNDTGTVTISHRSHFDPEAIKESLGVSVESFDYFMSQANALSEQGINVTQARELLREIFGQPTEKEIKATDSNFEFAQMMAQFHAPGVKLREQRSVDRVLALFDGEGIGSQLPTTQGTKWGLLNAVTQHIDHERGRTDDSRMEGAWFGTGDEQKRKTFDLLVGA